MSKCPRQLERHVICVLPCLVRVAGAFFPAPSGRRKATDSLAGLSEVKGLKSSTRVAGRGQCGVLETSTAAETMVHREGTRNCLVPRTRQV